VLGFPYCYGNLNRAAGDQRIVCKVEKLELVEFILNFAAGDPIFRDLSNCRWSSVASAHV